jgi:hypothetical protein
MFGSFFIFLTKNHYLDGKELSSFSATRPAIETLAVSLARRWKLENFSLNLSIINTTKDD